MCYVKANGNRLDAIANRKDRQLHENPKENQKSFKFALCYRRDSILFYAHPWEECHVIHICTLIFFAW